MTPTEASQLLGISPDSTPEQIEAQFQAMRHKLEDRIAKAPTPGLKTKYRESLDQITQAFEALTLAADSSALPVLRKESEARIQNSGERPAASAPSASSTNPKSEIQNRKSSKEFTIVAIIAVLVLAGGGWFVMKTRAENAEKERLTAVAKAEAEQQAELTKQAAEAKRVAEQKEKERLAAEAKAEAERVAAAKAAESERIDKLSAQTRATLAELRITWDAYDQKVRQQERKVSELKADERNLSNQLKGAASPELLKLRAELSAEEEFTAWLSNELLRHPARIARVQAEELLNAKQVDDAATATQRAQGELAKLDKDITTTAESMLTLTGKLRIEVSPTNSRWELVDAYGSKRTGTGPSELGNIPLGRVRISFTLRGFEDMEASGTLRRGQALVLKNEFVAPVATIASDPAGAEIWLAGEMKGTTPATLTLPGDSPVRGQVRLTGYAAIDFLLDPAVAGTLQQSLKMNPAPKAAPAQNPVVIIIRDKLYVGWAAKLHINVDGTRRFSLSNGSYQQFQLSPGTTHVTVDPGTLGQKNSDLDLRTEPGQVYFLKAALAASTFSTHSTLTQINEDEAKALMANLKELSSPMDFSSGNTQ